MTATLAILTEGRSDPLSAKTAVSLLRYRLEDVVALVDTQHAGKTAGQLLGVGGDVPVVASLDQAVGASELVIGVATAGGGLPDMMRSAVLDAARRGWTVTSGLHEFLCDDSEIAEAARQSGAVLHDVRKHDARTVADRKDLREGCLRIMTVGQDCSCGKMAVSAELAKAMLAAGHDAKFVPTGQTGIMVARGINAGLPAGRLQPGELDDPTGGGVPLDAVVSDFVNGEAELLVKRNQHHDTLIIEGQASLVHPSYSAVTYGLLHGALPHGLILCYEADRPHMHGRPHLKLTPLAILKTLYETVGSLEQPCRVIGVALNGRLLKDDAAREAERALVSEQLGLPVCDVYHDGPGALVDAVVAFKERMTTPE